MIEKEQDCWLVNLNMLKLLDEAVDEFKKLDDEVIRIVSHIDTDGITAAAILVKALKKEGRNFVLSNIKKLDQNYLKELNSEPYNVIFFLDFGSGHLNLIKNNLGGKKIFIFDHHVPENVENDFIHVNPHLTNQKDASSQICSAGITYLFSKKLDDRNKELAYLALIGATGDIQEFEGLNKGILEDSISSGKIEVKKGLRIFGAQTRPLHKMLQYSTDPYIPGVTGSEEGAIEFLEESNIAFKQEGKVKRLVDLEEEEVKSLTASIILKRVGKEKNPEDVVGDIYLLREEEEGSSLKDIREFSTLLNCCGRLGRASLGIGVCLKDKDSREKAMELLLQYKKEIINGLNWFYENKDQFSEDRNFLIVNFKDKVRDTIVGVIAGILSKSNVYDDGKIILSMAYTEDNEIKVSMRITGNSNDVDLREIMKKLVKDIGEGGGHRLACGATLPIDKEEMFLERAAKLLKIAK